MSAALDLDQDLILTVKVPQLIVHLIKRILDSDPLNRPKAEEIEKILIHIEF
uniref:Uncharacterized protein n=1 Tax=Rhizophagus irregularis (strain DAOM 181602 / DAOM 197198 / MUCL 43194) TaxID=747089 RepID=U9TJS6_RHIID